MRPAPWTTIPLLLAALAHDASAQQSPPDPAAATTRPRVIFPAPRVAVYASLAYEREPGAEVCPGEQVLREELAARMGYDPFTPNPEGISVGDISISVAKTSVGFIATYTWTGSGDVQKPIGQIDIRGHSRRDCFDAIDSVAADLAVSLSILEADYGRRFAPKKSATTCPATSTAPAPAQCKDSRFSVWPTEWPLPPLEKPKLYPPEPPERWPVAVRVGAAVWPELIASGWGSLGFSIEAGVRYRWFSANVEAHGDPPIGSQSFQNLGTVTFARLSGGLVLCAHFGWFTGCGVADAGRVFFPHHIHYLPASVFYGSAGTRAGLDFPVIPSRLFLRVAVDLRAPLRPASYAPGGHDIFRAAGPSAGLGIGMLAELPP